MAALVLVQVVSAAALVLVQAVSAAVLLLAVLAVQLLSVSTSTWRRSPPPLCAVGAMLVAAAAVLIYASVSRALAGYGESVSLSS